MPNSTPDSTLISTQACKADPNPLSYPTQNKADSSPRPKKLQPQAVVETGQPLNAAVTVPLHVLELKSWTTYRKIEKNRSRNPRPNPESKTGVEKVEFSMSLALLIYYYWVSAHSMAYSLW